MSQNLKTAPAGDSTAELLRAAGDTVHASDPIALQGDPEPGAGILPIVVEMLKQQGLYIGGDSKYPDVTVPIVVMGGAPWSMKPDQDLDPARFLPTFTAYGPFTPAMLDSGSVRIHAERQRQVTTEGYSADHDDSHTDGSMILAGKCYALCAVEQLRWGTTPALPHPDWPWHQSYWHPSGDPARNLEKAGALYAAEIDRLQRAKDRKAVS